MESNCEDCGCPVEKRLAPGNSQPPMEIAYSYRNGREEYHDMSECINYLRSLIQALTIKVTPANELPKHVCDITCDCRVCNCCIGVCVENSHSDH